MYSTDAAGARSRREIRGRFLDSMVVDAGVVFSRATVSQNLGLINEIK